MQQAKVATLTLRVAVAAFILCLAALFLAGCARDGAKPGSKRIYTRAEFHAEFMGATLDHVRAKLGAPDLVIDSESRWVYKGRTKPDKPKLNRTGEDTGDVSLQHRDGRVYFISYSGG